jgi:hypothetical protein
MVGCVFICTATNPGNTVLLHFLHTVYFLPGTVIYSMCVLNQPDLFVSFLHFLEKKAPPSSLIGPINTLTPQSCATRFNRSESNTGVMPVPRRFILCTTLASRSINLDKDAFIPRTVKSWHPYTFKCTNVDVALEVHNMSRPSSVILVQANLRARNVCMV